MSKKKKTHSIQTACLNSIHNTLGIRLETIHKAASCQTDSSTKCMFIIPKIHVKKEQTEFINIDIT